MGLSPKRLGRRSSSRQRQRHPVVEPLEDRSLLDGGPFPVGGDPIVNPADFRITTFASGLNYPKALMSLSDGSLLVAVNNPLAGGTSFYSSTGELLRFTDVNGDGVADGAGQVLFDNLPGGVTAVHQAGPYIVATSTQTGSERISVLHEGATPSSPLTLAGSIYFSFPANWEHTTYASVVRPTPGQPGSYDLIFNIGSQYNGVVIGSDGRVVLDQNGNPTYQPTTGTVTASGLVSGTLEGDSLYMVTLTDQGGSPVISNLTQIATGLRNAASLAIDPTSGDLYLADNGIDGNSYGNEAWSADELDVIPAAQIGHSVVNFGFPYSYIKTIDKPGDPVTVVDPTFGVQPLIGFEPLPDPVLTAEGSESEGSSGFALSPPNFPAGLNQGVFIGFHGLFVQGGTANDENPFIFANPSTGHYFDFISNDLANIGHLDEAMSTSDSLFLADLSMTGAVSGSSGPGQGFIYQIQAINQQSTNHPPVLAPIGNQTVDEGTTLAIQASATDPDPGQTLTYSLGPGAPSGATIDPGSGAFSWTPDPYRGAGSYSITITVTDNGSPPLSDSTTFNVNVLAVNHPPVLAPISPLSVNEGSLLTFVASATDPDVPAQTISYSLGTGSPSGAAIDAKTGRFSWTPDPYTSSGNYAITIVATDNGTPPLAGSDTVSVTVLPVNHPPILAPIGAQTTSEGTLVSFQASATDRDVPAQSITYSLGSGAPSGAMIDAYSGVFSWIPDPYASSGTYQIKIIATDSGSPPLSDSKTFTLTVLAVNHPPEFSDIPRQAVEQASTLKLSVANFVKDLDRPSQVLSYQLVSGPPAGSSIDPVSGAFTWPVPSSQPFGTYAISVVASDNGSPPMSALQTFLVDVVPFNHPPVLAPIPAQTVVEGTKLTVTAQATDIDSPPQTITYGLSPGAPLAASIDPQTGVFTWTPNPYAGAGDYAITIVATDNGAVPKSDMTTLAVHVLAVNHPPVIKAIPVQTVAPGRTLKLGLAGFVSDLDRPAQKLHYELAVGAPAGASIDPNSGLFTWATTPSQHIGAYAFGIIVTDSGSPQMSQSANFRASVVDTHPATILKAKVDSRRGLSITLTFSQPLDPSSASNTHNYILVAPGKARKTGSKGSPPTTISLTVHYNPKSNSVTLVAQGKPKLNPALQLTVVGMGPGGIAKVTGLLLAGRGGKPGTNYVASVTATRIKQTNP
jgi:hypothetical protein